MLSCDIVLNFVLNTVQLEKQKTRPDRTSMMQVWTVALDC